MKLQISVETPDGRVDAWNILFIIGMVVLFAFSMLAQSLMWGDETLIGLADVAIQVYWASFVGCWLILSLFVWVISNQAGTITQTGVVWCIILVAVMARVVIVSVTQPILSDDIWRYIHDGATFAQGENPYLHAPADVPDDQQPIPQIIDRINNLDLITIYQPASQFVFAGLDRMWSVCPVFVKRWDPNHDKVFRFGFMLFDMLLIGVILAWLRDVGSSPWWAVAYAWHPLAISEVAGSGHQDVVGIAPLVLVLYLASRLIRSISETPLPFAGGEAGRGGANKTHHLLEESGPHPDPLPGGEGVEHTRSQPPSAKQPLAASHRVPTAIIAGIAFGLALAVKPIILPIALALAWMLRKRPTLIAWAAGATTLTIAALYSPFVLMQGGLAGMFDTGRTFIDKWAFNGSAYPLFAHFIAGKLWANVAALIVLLVVLIVTTRRERTNPARPTGAFLFASLLVSSTVHPWYLLWALALTPIWFSPAFWVFSLTVVASYAAHLYEGYRVPQWVVICEYIPVYAVLAWELYKWIRNNRMFRGRSQIAAASEI